MLNTTGVRSTLSQMWDDHYQLIARHHQPYACLFGYPDIQIARYHSQAIIQLNRTAGWCQDGACMEIFSQTEAGVKNEASKSFN